MTEVWIREATVEDIGICSGRHENTIALAGYMTMSDKTYVGLVDGEIVCIWGVMRQSLVANRGYLWLLVTEKAEAHKFLIIRYSQRIIDQLLNRYSMLIGECTIGDYRARKWMRLLGATFGQSDGKLIPFQIERKHG